MFTKFPLFLQYFNFTYFALSLNELTEETAGKLAPTDSRYRRDIRLLEEGTIGKYILPFMISYMLKKIGCYLIIPDFCTRHRGISMGY